MQIIEKCHPDATVRQQLTNTIASTAVTSNSLLLEAGHPCLEKAPTCLDPCDSTAGVGHPCTTADCPPRCPSDTEKNSAETKHLCNEATCPPRCDSHDGGRGASHPCSEPPCPPRCDSHEDEIGHPCLAKAPECVKPCDSKINHPCTESACPPRCPSDAGTGRAGSNHPCNESLCPPKCNSHDQGLGTGHPCSDDFVPCSPSCISHMWKSGGIEFSDLGERTCKCYEKHPEKFSKSTSARKNANKN